MGVGRGFVVAVFVIQGGLIGVLASILPARSAARLDPVTAIGQ